MNSIDADEVLSNLITLGFFRFAQPTDLNRITTNIKHNLSKYGELESGDAYIDSVIPLDRRLYHADAESLAEQGVCRFLNNMKPVLELEGVRLASLRNDARWNEKGEYIYSVWINDEQYRICDTSQGEKHCWCLAHKRTIEIINTLLIAAGSQEHAYRQASANDAKILLLTEELFNYIRSLPFREYWIPFRAKTMQCE